MTTKEATLLVARHGESVWNATGRWQGQADPPLSPLGEEQARAAGRLLARSHRFDAIVSSDLQRALRTAQLIASELDSCVEVEPRLRERHAGRWTGLTRAEIDERFPGWREAHRHPPGFETDELLLRRVLAALTDLVATRPAGSILVITHGGVVRIVERHLGVEAPPLPNLGARELSHTEAGSWRLGDRVLLLDGRRPGDGFVTVPAEI